MIKIKVLEGVGENGSFRVLILKMAHSGTVTTMMNSMSQLMIKLIMNQQVVKVEVKVEVEVEAKAVDVAEAQGPLPLLLLDLAMILDFPKES